MIVGIIFILGGILIFIYPAILAYIISFILIFIGVWLIYLSYYYRRAAKKFNDPFIDFFFRL